MPAGTTVPESESAARLQRRGLGESAGKPVATGQASGQGIGYPQLPTGSNDGGLKRREIQKYHAVPV